jgi:DNA-binding NarL/FixJ family response regulator
MPSPPMPPPVAPQPVVPPGIAGAPGGTGPPPATLTPREREIAALIARGLSNRAIGAELYIAPATVARHVANMLTKLGFSSRAQVAAWVAGQPGPPG